MKLSPAGHNPEQPVFQNSVASGKPVLWQGKGTGVAQSYALPHFRLGNMGVPVQKNIALAQGGQLGWPEIVPVGDENSQRIHHQPRKAGGKGEGEHGFINGAVAVPAHGQYLRGKGVENFTHLFGEVFVGQGVARPVVQNIAKHKHTVGLLGLYCSDHEMGGLDTAVDIGKNAKFHGRIRGRKE